MKNKIDRREFLSSMASFGCLFTIAAPVQSLLNITGNDHNKPPVARLSELIIHQDSAAVVGREYLKLAPAEAKKEKLATAILEKMNLAPAALPGMTTVKLHKKVQTQIRKDFQDGTTVELHGWILSRTEARLFALVSLTA